MPSSTTHSSPLSLHDALPIPRRAAAAGEERDRQEREPRPARDHAADRRAVDAERGRAEVAVDEEPVARDRHHHRDDAGDHLHPRDRKSTRLNSSHLGISYAVFYHPLLPSFPTRRSSDPAARRRGG